MSNIKNFTGSKRNLEELFTDENIFVRWDTYEEYEYQVKHILETTLDYTHLCLEYLRKNIGTEWTILEDGQKEGTFEITGTLYDEFDSMSPEMFVEKWNQIKHIVGGGYEEFIRECTYEDVDLFEIQWEYLVEALTNLIEQLNPYGYWYAEVLGFGWRKLNGYKTFEADTGTQFLQSILLDTDCTFTIYTDEENQIGITNSHHDGSESYVIVSYDDEKHPKF